MTAGMGSAMSCGGTHEVDQKTSIEDDIQRVTGDDLKPASKWTLEMSDHLQEAVDRIFGTGCESLLGLNFSFTIADPQLEGCPLIGCSTGFTTLCGYEMSEIVGRNCRFLVDPVPADQVDQAMRRRCRDYCSAIKGGSDYRVPDDEVDPWLPMDRPGNEFWAVQKNARKNGTLFNNMFYMRAFGLGDFDDERQYIVALQSELLGGKADLARLCQHVRQLDKNMARVEKILGREFIMSGPMRRQDLDVADDDDDDDLAIHEKDAAHAVEPIPPCAEGA
mmetsp:Transcript_34922/g.61365  ORF Transcript_34922/g.61365 Transcript_34922/m.61365 type:complete len:277 (+) Transcript_34922:57-887(+)